MKLFAKLLLVVFAVAYGQMTLAADQATPTPSAESAATPTADAAKPAQGDAAPAPDKAKEAK